MHGHPRTQAAEPGPSRSMAPQTQWPVAVVPQGPAAPRAPLSVRSCGKSLAASSGEAGTGLLSRPRASIPLPPPFPTSVPVCTSESPWEAESVLLGDQPDRRPPYRLSSQRLPGPLFCLSHLLLC